MRSLYFYSSQTTYFLSLSLSLFFLSHTHTTHSLTTTSQVRLLTTLRHPNIVKLLHFYPNPPSLIFEFVGGGNLEDALAEIEGPISWRLMLKVRLNAYVVSFRGTKYTDGTCM